MRGQQYKIIVFAAGVWENVFLWQESLLLLGNLLGLHDLMWVPFPGCLVSASKCGVWVTGTKLTPSPSCKKSSRHAEGKEGVCVPLRMSLLYTSYSSKGFAVVFDRRHRYQRWLMWNWEIHTTGRYILYFPSTLNPPQNSVVFSVSREGTFEDLPLN